MGIQSIKLNVVQKILSIEQESVIKKINEILENEMIVGYTVDGDSLTKKQYNQRIELAEKQINSGEIISQEELEKQSENW